MADHGVQRPSPGNPLTRRQKDINLAINREGVAKAVAAAAVTQPSVSSILASRGDVIDAVVEDSQRKQKNQTTDSNN